MNKYIQKSLAADIIRLSSSLAGVVFFFMGKRYGGLHHCIDYRGLNAITVKIRYHLPLMSSAVESLQGVTVSTQLDLHNA